MKVIGEKLKEAREESGVSISEVAEDLKLKEIIIECIEAGEIEKFKNIINLKDTIRNYAKYLGLDEEGVIDEFNEYLFDYTSKIPLTDIKEASGVTETKEKIVSPYTTNKKGDNNTTLLIIGLIVVVFIGLLLLYLYVLK